MARGQKPTLVSTKGEEVWGKIGPEEEGIHVYERNSGKTFSPNSRIERSTCSGGI
jgi:hypothetical protein